MSAEPAAGHEAPGAAGGDLLRQPRFRRLLASLACSTLGHQFTLLALPLTAAVLLQATPTQMGLLTALEMLPFALFSLPAGVWLDRVRKLPVYIAGELLVASAAASVPIAWALGWLTMEWLYAVAFLLGTVTTTAGSAAQVVFTQVVPRERLVEAHSRSALAESGAEIAGPGLAAAFLKFTSAPIAMLASAGLALLSAIVLRGITREPEVARDHRDFWAELREGLRFVRQQPLLGRLTLLVAMWQACLNSAQVVQILLATRELALPQATVGLLYVALGAGTVAGSLMGHAITVRLGPGPTFALALSLSGAAWLCGALAPAGPAGAWAFGTMLAVYGVSGTLLYINFLAMRQAVTPGPLLGRMTSTVRWLILLPAGPAALLSGWLGEHVSLRAPLALAGMCAILLGLLAWRMSVVRTVHRLPQDEPALN